MSNKIDNLQDIKYKKIYYITSQETIFELYTNNMKNRKVEKEAP